MEEKVEVLSYHISGIIAQIPQPDFDLGYILTNRKWSLAQPAEQEVNL